MRYNVISDTWITRCSSLSPMGTSPFTFGTIVRTAIYFSNIFFLLFIVKCDLKKFFSPLYCSRWMEYTGSDDGVRRDGGIAGNQDAICFRETLVWLSQ